MPRLALFTFVVLFFISTTATPVPAQSSQELLEKAQTLNRNGFLDEAAVAWEKLATTDTPFFIGGRAADSPQKFEGVIDEVRLFKRALSQSEIQALMEKGDEAQAVAPENNLASTWGNIKAINLEGEINGGTTN